jgi:hypothetical protein
LENKKIFEKSPSSYIPQWGGFCSWGISAEYCPKYAWDSDCLGPPGNWGVWTIQENRLFFFLKSEAKDKFMEDVIDYIDDGDNRWNEWFQGSVAPFSTDCYVASGFSDLAGQELSLRKTGLDANSEEIDDECGPCPIVSSCSVEGHPVLGGVDVVQYFTEFKLADGSYGNFKR